MERHHIFSVVLVASAISGMLSPAMFIVAVFSWVWMPPFLLGSAGLIFFASMIVTSTATLLLAGVPAALYERVAGVRDDRTALWIWAASAIAIALVGLGWRFGLTASPAA
jgi:hypothetical protein